MCKLRVQVISVSHRASLVHYIILFYGYVGASCCCRRRRVHTVRLCGVRSEVVTGAVCRGEGQGGAGWAVVVGRRGPGVREIISFFVTNFRI